MEHGTLQHALETERRLGVALTVVITDQRRCIINKLQHRGTQIFNIGATGREYFHDSAVVEHSQEQVLNRHELVTMATSMPEGLIQGHFQFFAEHGDTSLSASHHSDNLPE